MGELTYRDAGPAGQIGQLYRSAYRSHVDSVRQLIEAGRQLIAHKEAIAHGDWMLWLKQHQDALGFSDRVAQMLMAGARKWDSKLASGLTEEQAVTISREIWGHEREISPYPAGPPVAYVERVVSWTAKHLYEEFDEVTDEQRARLLECAAQMESWLQGLRTRLQRNYRRAA